jgi:hypothetical protein
MLNLYITKKRCLPSALYQSWVHKRASTVSGVRLLRKSFMVLLIMLKADSDSTDEARTANKSRAIREKVGYFVVLPIHQFIMSNSSARIGSSSKYLSSSVLLRVRRSLLDFFYTIPSMGHYSLNKH